MRLGLFILGMLFFGNLWAQDQMALRLNEKGLLKILDFVIKYNTSEEGKRSLEIPQKIYPINIKKAVFHKNPVIPILDQFTNLDFSKDLSFYLKSSKIIIDGQVDPKSFSAIIEKSDVDSFDVKVKINIKEVLVKADKLSVREKISGKGFMADFHNVAVKTIKNPINLTLRLRIRTDNGVVRANALSVETNLNQKNGPRLDIQLGRLDLPEGYIITPDGEKVALGVDSNEIKEKILNQKNFLAHKLIDFSADFVARDLTEMINRYLINKKFITSAQYQYEVNIFNEKMANLVLQPGSSDSYDKPTVYEDLIGLIYSVVHKTQVNLSLNKVVTPQNKDIVLGGALKLVLNDEVLNFKNGLGNSSQILPPLDLSSYRESDINLAISEPLLNSTLDLINSTGLFKKIFESKVHVKGVELQSVKMHFTKRNSIALIANVNIDLDQIEAPTIWSKTLKYAGKILERKTNGKIYFPLEIEVYPNFYPHEGGMEIYLEVLSPFEGDTLVNSFSYPSNLHEVSDTVKGVIFDKLRAGLGAYTDNFYNLDITKLLNQSGVEFKPVSISIENQSYILLNLDLVDIKFRAKP